MTQENGEVIVRDLGSTNGIRINGQRVEMGRLRPGDELSIAHIRYRLDDGRSQEMTMADPHAREDGHHIPFRIPESPARDQGENPLAAAVRELLPPSVADRCRIQVIVQMKPDADKDRSGDRESCPPDSSH